DLPHDSVNAQIFGYVSEICRLARLVEADNRIKNHPICFRLKTLSTEHGQSNRDDGVVAHHSAEDLLFQPEGLPHLSLGSLCADALATKQPAPPLRHPPPPAPGPSSAAPRPAPAWPRRAARPRRNPAAAPAPCGARETARSSR